MNTPGGRQATRPTPEALASYRREHRWLASTIASAGVVVATLAGGYLVAASLNLKKLRVVETGGDSFEAEREQWDDGNNVVALEPGVVVAYDRNVHTNTLLRKAGVEPA